MLTGSLQLSVYITRLICKAAHLLYGIWKPRLQWHYKHTLETTDSFPFFFFFWLFFPFSFFYKMVQTTIQNICAVDNLQKKSFDSITVQLYFFCFFVFFFLFSSFWKLYVRVWYTRIPSVLDLQPRSCGLRHVFKMSVWLL